MATAKYSTRRNQVLHLPRDPTRLLYYIVQHKDMVLLLICWFCVGGLIAFALNLDLGEWICKKLNKLIEPVVSLLLLPIQLEINDARVL